MLQNALLKALFYSSHTVSQKLRVPVVRWRTLPLKASLLGLRSPSRAYGAAPYQIGRNHGTAVDPLIYGNDTIYALSTAPGRAAIAIVRISGPSCIEVRQDGPPKRIARLTQG